MPEQDTEPLTNEARMTQAVGLASTILPEMEIDIEDPVGMMQKVVSAFAGLNDEQDDAVRKAVSELEVERAETIENLRIEVVTLRSEIERLKALRDRHLDIVLAAKASGIDVGMAQAAMIVKHMAERTQPAHDIVLLNEAVAAIRAYKPKAVSGDENQWEADGPEVGMEAEGDAP